MSDIYGGKDSLTCFNLLLDKGRVDYIEELNQLYEISYRELLIRGNSGFVDLIYNRLLGEGIKIRRFKNIYINIKPNNSNFVHNLFRKSDNALCFFDAYSFIVGFYYYFGDSKENFFNYLDAMSKKLFKNLRYHDDKNVNNNIEVSLKIIDKSIYDKREKLFIGNFDDSADILRTSDECIRMKELAARYYNETIANTDREVQNLKKEAEERTREQTERILENARQKAVDEEENTRRTIIQNAHNEAYRIKQSVEEQANKLFSEAQAKQTRIIENAKQEEAKIIGRANQRAIDIQHRADRTYSKNKSTYCDTSFEDIRRKLLTLNESLSVVNGKMKKMEDTLNQQHTQEIYDQLTELYDIIDDVKNFTLQSAQEKDSVDLKNSALNMGEFQDMITEYLESYGVQTIYSVPGEAFNGKYHAVKTKDFDPQNSIVTKSLKVGFMWGNQVMQKELVEIKNKEL